MELALRCYQYWGDGCAEKILGDFSLAIWDIANKCLYCARDILGLRSFYYYVDQHLFAFATEAEQLIEHPLISRHANESVVAEFLALNFISHDETLYEGIKRLPPAHQLMVDINYCRPTRYWEIQPEVIDRSITADQAREGFSAVFKQSVLSRCRVNTSLGIKLSGGIDSSTVAGMVARLQQEAAIDVNVKAYSNIYPGMDCDESRYIDSVGQYTGITATRLPYRDKQWQHWLKPNLQHVGLANFPVTHLDHDLAQSVTDSGCRVLLTGVGGDSWFTGSLYSYYDLWCSQRRCQIIPEYIYQLNEIGFRPSLAHLVRSLLWPWLPTSQRRALLTRVKTRAHFDWLSPELIKGSNLAERGRQRYSPIKFNDLAQWDIVRHACQPMVPIIGELQTQWNARHGIEDRHPFHDRRVIEYALTLPNHLRRRLDVTKFVLRQPGLHLLPEPVRRRDDKAGFSFSYQHALGQDTIVNLAGIENLVQKGWVLRPQLDILLDRHKHQDCSFRETAGLWMLVAISHWAAGSKGSGTYPSPLAKQV